MHIRYHNKKSLNQIRKDLRNGATEAEQFLWEHLKGAKTGRKFRRQHSVANYVLDFYCPSERIAIELDGEVHLEKEQKEKDIERDENLQQMEIKVLRFKNQEVFSDLDKVLKKIKSYFQ